METLPPDFREFLSFLNSHEVRFLVVGGYAVSHHGFPRYTDDLDVWIAIDATNPDRIVAALKSFGFDLPDLTKEKFREKMRVVRMGRPPMRIEILTSISGVEFEECYPRRIITKLGDVEVPMISLRDLRENKAASGRSKDLADLDNLPESI